VKRQNENESRGAIGMMTIKHGFSAILSFAIIIVFLLESLSVPVGGTTLMMADLEDLPDYLVEAGITPLLLAVTEGMEPEARQLVAKGADVNLKNSEGWSPLFLAGHMGKVELFEFFCRQRINVRDQDPLGNTPLHYAAAFGQRALIEDLLKKKAGINAGRGDRQTPLHFAALYGQRDVADLLIARGANVHAQSEAGTPLHLAAFQGHVDLIRLLLDKRARVNARDPKGNTPLHDAMSQGRREAADLLISAGADINAVNEAGEKPAIPPDKMPVDFDHTNRDAVMALARQIETVFYQSVEKRDMTPFHKVISKQWQEHMTVAELNDSYRLLMMLARDRQYWKGQNFILEWPATLGQDGMLRVMLRYPAPDEHAFIEHVYLPEGGAFKLGGYHLSFRPYNEAWERHSRASVRFYEAGDTGKAIEEGNRALRIASSLDPVEPKLTLMSAGSVANMYAARMQFDDTLPLRILALTIADKAYGRADLRVAEQLDHLMAAFAMTGRKEEAALCDKWGDDVRAAAAGDKNATERIEAQMDINLLQKNIPGFAPTAPAEDPMLTDLRKKAQAGNARAQLSLASAYGMGMYGLEKDPVVAAQWTLKAAESGLAGAQHSMASRYQSGIGVPKDIDKALGWYQKAADQNYSSSMFSLGLLYETGRVVPKDTGKALYWFRLAEKNGSKSAGERVKKLEEGGAP